MAKNNTAPCSAPCLQATALNTVQIKQRELGELEPGQCRVKAELSMVSTGTELHTIQGTHTQTRPFPRSTGYIALGHIVGVGDRVEGLELGQRVLSPFAHLSLIDVPAGRLKPVPEGIASTDAVCTVLLSISIRGVRAAKVQLGDSVAVFGQGVIGGFATHLAKLAGACPVIAVDLVAARRQVALKMGADVVIDPAAEDARERIMEITGGEGVRAAIEATATTKVIGSLPALTARQGRIIVLGGIHGTAELDLYTFFQKSDQRLIGCGSAHHDDFPYGDDEANRDAILRMMKAGMIKPGPVVTHRVPYTEAPEMYRMLIEEKDKAIGVQFDWTNA